MSFPKLKLLHKQPQLRKLTNTLFHHLKKRSTQLKMLPATTLHTQLKKLPTTTPQKMSYTQSEELPTTTTYTHTMVTVLRPTCCTGLQSLSYPGKCLLVLMMF